LDVVVSAVRKLALLMAPPLLALTALPSPAEAAFAVPIRTRVLMGQVVEMTNSVREEHGCRPLDVDHDLIQASETQSIYMARTHTFSHYGWGGSNFITRARAAGYDEPAGENIAWGFDSADAVMDAWMASPRHRANILNCDAKSIGTGIQYANDGTIYYTQVFGWK
jgi:uncharacterized protein YkwD